MHTAYLLDHPRALQLWQPNILGRRLRSMLLVGTFLSALLGHGQPATAVVEAQMAHASDTLQAGILLVQSERVSILNDMRRLNCDTTEVWGFAERASELRMEMCAALDSLQMLNDRLMAEDPARKLFNSLHWMDPGIRLHAVLKNGMLELRSLCFDAECRNAVTRYSERILADTSPFDWTLQGLFGIPAMALRPVLLTHSIAVERAVRDVLSAQRSHCQR